MMIARSILGIVLLLFCKAVCAEERIQVPCAIQISSKTSDGKLTIPEILAACRSKGIKAVILTDRDLMQWEYGIWPLRNVIKKTVAQKSLFSYGLDRYLGELAKIKEKNPDLIIIAGVESAAFYYWKGSVFNDDLTLGDWHKHIVAAGLREKKDYALLPVIGNKRALALPYSVRTVYLFWPLLMIAAGVFLCRHRRMILGVILTTIGAVFLINNYPFAHYRFDQYHGAQGAKPYQGYIDYVKNRGGLTFWVHPEACNQCRIGNVRIDTEEYPLDLYRTQDYTGFSILYEGEKKIGAIGGIWDRLLEYYCQGKRGRPVWAIATLGFDDTGELGDALEDLRTVVLADGFTEEALLSALGQGSAYILAGKNSGSFVLDNFSVFDTASGKEQTMGQTLTAGRAPLVRIKGHLLRGQPGVFTIQLIKNGKVVKEFKEEAPFDIAYQDAEEDQEKAFYRMVIEGNGIRVFTNPIFLTREQP